MINVLMFFDDKYYKSALVTLLSMISNTNDDVVLYSSKEYLSIHNKIDLLGFNERIKIKWIDDVDKKMNSLYKNEFSSFPPVTLARLIAPFLIDVDRILYLDADIVIKADMKEIYDIDLLINMLLLGAIKTHLIVD